MEESVESKKKKLLLERGIKNASHIRCLSNTKRKGTDVY